MRAIHVYDSDQGRHFQIEEDPKPEPRSGQVLIQVQAIGVNRADLGRRPPMSNNESGGSFVPGLDVAGTISVVGSDVEGWHVGDPVMALVGRGAYAEFALARTGLIYPPPEGMSLRDASSVPCVFLTAWHGLVTLGKLQPGETVLIHAAGSGVGTAGIQIAKAYGARVLTSAGSDLKLAKGKELGAESGVNYSTQDVTVELLRLTDGKGVDVVLDSVGGPIFDKTLPALAQGGRVVTPGSPSGERSPLDEQQMKVLGQEVQGIRVGDETAKDKDGLGWAWLTKHFEDGSMYPVIDKVLPWTQAEEAQRLLVDRALFGKVVMEVGV